MTRHPPPLIDSDTDDAAAVRVRQLNRDPSGQRADSTSKNAVNDRLASLVRLNQLAKTARSEVGVGIQSTIR